MPSLQLTFNGIGVAQSIEEILTPETGRILRQAREARGLNIGDVSARLRLNPHFIESMEAGDPRPLPPGPYRKAFLSEYAKFLNLKIEELLPPIEGRTEGMLSSAVSAMPAVAKKMTQSAVKTTESVVKKVEEGVKDAVEEITARDLWEEADEVRNERLGITARKEVISQIAVRKKEDLPLIEPPFLEPDLIEKLPPPKQVRRSRRLDREENIAPDEFSPVYKPKAEEEDDRSGMSRATKTIVALLAVIVAIVGYSIFTKKQSQPAVITEPEQKTAAKPPEQKPKPIVPAKTDSTATASASNDSLVFTISAKDTVWVSVSSDAGQGFKGKLAKGEVRRFSAKDKYILYLGNQKAVSMTLDGKPLTDLPTVPGSNLVVRNVTLSRNKIGVAASEQKAVPEPPVRKKEAKLLPSPTKDKKTIMNPPIKKPIHPVKPVLPR